jgi:hypothetical protein
VVAEEKNQVLINGQVFEIASDHASCPVAILLVNRPVNTLMPTATVEDHAAFSTSEQSPADVSTVSAACDGRSDVLNWEEI